MARYDSTVMPPHAQPLAHVRSSALRRPRGVAFTVYAVRAATACALTTGAVSADLLWDNGIVPDGRASRAMSPPAFPEVRAVDDVTVPGPHAWTLRQLRATVVEMNEFVSGSEITLHVREHDDGPGPIHREFIVPFDRIATGEEYFGLSAYEYALNDLDFELCPGTYWLGLRNHDATGGGTNFWLSSDGGADGPTSDRGYYSLDGGRSWNRETKGRGRAFEVSGMSSMACGACCLAEGACVQRSQRECDALHGLYRYNGATCESAECPVETAACCLSDERCVDTSSEECDILGGAPGPADSDCRDENQNGRSDACEEGCVRDPVWRCDGDVDGDGQVNPVDSGLVQSAFGSADGQDLCNYDLDCDGQINPVDSGIVQSLFGTCDSPRGVCP